MTTSTLFQPLTLAGRELPNRIVMAPMTRARSSQPGDSANALMAEYYAQRASAGLIITEATQISPQGKGYSFTPGIYSAEQVSGWRQVTDAVHAAGGRIYLQLWHVGRMSTPAFMPMVCRWRRLLWHRMRRCGWWVTMASAVCSTARHRAN